MKVTQEGSFLRAGTRRTRALAAQVVKLCAVVNLALALPLLQADADPARPVKIVAFGDSLTAGFQLPSSQAFPAQLAGALAARGHAVEVINAGVSGDTTAAGLERFAWAVPDDTDAVILELGANDALRGLPPDAARANLEAIIERLKARNIDVLLAGMRALSNWGPEYERAFNAMYADLAARHDLILYPFFLEGVARDPALNLPDGLHPSAKGIAVIVARILPSVEELIARVAARRAAGSKS